MQVIDVLGHQQQFAGKLSLQPGQRLMRRIGRDIRQGGAAHVVEADDQIGVSRESFGGGDILDPVLFPQATGGAEGVDPAFGGNPRPGEDDDAIELCHETFKHEA